MKIETVGIVAFRCSVLVLMIGILSQLLTIQSRVNSIDFLMKPNTPAAIEYELNR